MQLAQVALLSGDGMSPRQRDVIFDITRLATRFSRTTPNGIDRVDLGYAQHFLSEARGGRGAILGPIGVRAIDNLAARGIADAITKHWREEGRAEDDETFLRLMARLEGKVTHTAHHRKSANAVTRAAQSMGRLLLRGGIVGRSGLIPGRNLARTIPEHSIYLNVNQFPLWLDWYFRWLDRRPDVKAVFFIHDLLPITYPEFFPPSEARRHFARLDVLARRSAGIIAASDYTRQSLEAHFRSRGNQIPPICVLPLPVSSIFIDSDVADLAPPQRDYFVAVGTIEPRKNQLLLLNIWRELAERFGDRTPALLLVGSRGWDNENIIDMLERCDRIRPHVHEIAGLSTAALKHLMCGARALLMPTLAEGYGLPVVEAHAAGVPLIVSATLSPWTQAGVSTTALDPLDGPGWRDAIIAHFLESSSPAGRPRQSFPLSWQWHIEHAENFLQSL